MKLWFVSFIFLVATEVLAQTTNIDWKTCQNPERANITIPFNQKNEFVANCAPEVLYSWRESAVLEKMIEAQKKGVGPVKSHPGKQLYLSKTPLSSHSYGDTAARIKLKKDVRFIFANAESSVYENAVRDCPYYEKKYPKDYDKMVLVANLQYLEFQEYILCTDGPIESWSYGTSEHLNEVEKEFSYFKKHPEPGQHENVQASAPLAYTEENKKKYHCADYKNCMLSELEKRIKLHRDLVKKNMGQIFYLDPAATKESHFHSTKKYYYSLGNENTPSEIETGARQ